MTAPTDVLDRLERPVVAVREATRSGGHVWRVRTSVPGRAWQVAVELVLAGGAGRVAMWLTRTGATVWLCPRGDVLVELPDELVGLLLVPADGPGGRP